MQRHVPRKRFAAILTILVGAHAGTIAQSPSAQSLPAAADWLTDGGDPQRTAWQRNERILDVSNVKGMTLLWKYKTDNEPREMHALFPPLIVGRVLTPS